MIQAQVPRFIPLTKWNDYFPDPTVSALRWMVFRDTNFANRCIVRRGRRLIVDADAYARWLEEQNPERSAPKGGNCG